MLIGKTPDIRYSEVTPKHVYWNRRQLLAGLSTAFVGRALAAGQLGAIAKSPLSVSEKPNPYKDATSYNNFYEFGTGKDQPSRLAQKFVTHPWTVSIEGAVAKPRKISIDEILHLAPLEERVYRFRCVEAWSMVVPWVGFPLSVILKQAEPTEKARYVAFQTLYDPRQMPQAAYAGIDFPYVEGLRLDEAMHPLALLTVGMYEQPLPPQDGAPVRIIVPWKYGFKSIKSIVRIRLVEKQPPTTWNLSNAHEYGFYSNVNPHVDHPRWTQSEERRLGEFRKRPTLMFNGYGDQVAALYNGMDLKKNY